MNARKWIFGAESEMKMLFCKQNLNENSERKGCSLESGAIWSVNQYGTKPSRLIPSNEVESWKN